MSLIDLTHTIRQHIPVFPGDEPAELVQVRSIEKDEFTNFRLTSEMHVGTHLDGPFHKISDSPLVSDLPLDRFTGIGVLIDVRGENQIAFRETYRTLIPEKSIALFYTGLSDHFGEKEYFLTYPDLTEELAGFLVEQRVKMVGLDWCSPDHHPYPIHEILLGNNILILENLTNLHQLLNIPNFEVFAFPLKIEADSSPVRVVARLIEC
jgi:kynurenine formamidase